MICPKCFNMNDDNSNNCVHCGNVLKEQVVQPVQPVVQQPVQPQVPQQPTTGIDMASMGLTQQAQQVPQQPMSDDPFMNQVFVQQATPKAPPKVDVKKISGDVLAKAKELLKNKYVLMGVGAVALIFVGVGVYNLLHKPSEEELMKAHPRYADAFFFKGDDDKYALISKEGKQLTDYMFDDAYYTFKDGYTVVSDDGKYGIMEDNGKMKVKYGKYEYILNVGGLYLATKGEEADYQSSYITGSGKVVISNTKDYELKTDASNSYISTFKYNNALVVYNYKGKKITSLSDGKDLFMHDEDVYAAIASDGKVVIVNAQKGKVLASFKDDKTYCINGVNEDGSIISINTCENSYYNSASADEDFKLIVNGKVIDTEDECDFVSLQYDNVMCVKDSERYLLNSKYERSVSFDEELAYVDGDNYAIYKDGSVLVYKDGKKVATIENVDDLNTGKVNDTYLVELDNDKYAFYNLDGKEVLTVEYDYVNAFDENERAIVSTDRDYYLINKKGEKVAGPYYYISAYDDYYVVKNKEDMYGAIDKDGKVLVDLKYDDIDSYTADLDSYLKLTKDDKQSLYSVKDKKIVIGEQDRLGMYDYYIEAHNGSDILYFTYNGKQFYEK